MEKKFKVQPLRGVEIHNAKSVGTRTVNLLMGEHQGEFVRGDIMDANAVVQAIDELKGGIDTGHDSLAKLNEEVKTNATVINGTITYANKIAADLQKEKDERALDFDTLNESLSTEKEQRCDAVAELREKIAAEATARTNADSEINKKIDVINGDSKTDGSIKKAIADVIDAAPEAYDTLKEIADKLKDNDDLHAVIQEAITEKASNEALTNEVNRATAKEDEIAQSVSDLDNLAVKGDGEWLGLVLDSSINNKEFIVNNKTKDSFCVALNTYHRDDHNKLYDSLFLNTYSIALKDYRNDEIWGVDRLFIQSTGITMKDSDGSNEKEALFVPATKPLIVDDKIADSYIPTTVALKTDLSEYIKTSDADEKYLSSEHFIVHSDGDVVFTRQFLPEKLLVDSVARIKYLGTYAGTYLNTSVDKDRSLTKVYNTNGGLCDLNNYAKLTNGNVNKLIDPADITSTNGEYSIDSVDSVNTSTVTISELAKEFNKLLTYVERLDSALKKANLLSESVVSE